MPTIPANIRLRPLRLLFLVGDNDKDCLRDAIEMNTVTWGGMFNIIAPLSASADNRVTIQTYLYVTEPDAIVVLTEAPEDLLVPYPKVERDAFFSPGLPGLLSNGVSVIDLYDWLYQQEYRFAPRGSSPILAEPGDQALELFNAICFGAFPAGSPLIKFRQQYVQRFEAEQKHIGASDLLNLYRARNAQLHLGSKGLSLNPRGKATFTYLYLHDGTHARDLIHLWNLRACGWNIVPVPIQWLPDLAGQLQSYLNTASRVEIITTQETGGAASTQFCDLVPNHGRLSSWNHINNLWSNHALSQRMFRCEVSAKQMRTEINLDDKDEFSLRTLLPDFESSAPFSSSIGYWVNVFDFVRNKHDLARDVVFPPGARDITGAISRLPDVSEVCYQNSEGIAVLIKARHDTELWRHPTGESVFAWWLTTVAIGGNGRLSDKGRIGLEMIGALNGLPGVRLISWASIINQLNSMADSQDSNGSAAKRDDWIVLLRKLHEGRLRQDTITGGITLSAAQELYQSSKIALGLRIECQDCQTVSWLTQSEVLEARCQSCHRELIEDGSVDLNKTFSNVQRSFSEKLMTHSAVEDSAKKHFEALLERGILKLGIQLKCAQCNRRTWYPINEISETVKCLRCLRTNAFPTSDPAAERGVALQAARYF